MINPLRKARLTLRLAWSYHRSELRDLFWRAVIPGPKVDVALAFMISVWRTRAARIWLAGIVILTP